MDFTKKSNLITIKIKGKIESFDSLKDIKEMCQNFLKVIRVDHKKKTLKDFIKIVSSIETNSELELHNKFK